LGAQPYQQIIEVHGDVFVFRPEIMHRPWFGIERFGIFCHCPPPHKSQVVVSDETDKWGKVIRAAHIKAE
jgi:hypothetical protein